MGKKGDLRDLVVSVRQAGRNISETVMGLNKKTKNSLCQGSERNGQPALSQNGGNSNLNNHL